jgi:precorrin-2 dehydrogenase / sirohydrochlorin ferrochelatase
MSLFPIFLKLTGRRCLVVGAGEIAESKIHSLLAADAHVIVVAPEAKPSLAEMAQNGHFEWRRREFTVEDLGGVFLAVAATDQPAVNAAVYRDAVDDPPHCDFYFPSTVSRGKLQIAISTSGESPALAQRLRKEIDQQLPADLGPWLDALGELRREVLAAMPASEPRKLLLHELAQRAVCQSDRCPSRQLAHDICSGSEDRTMESETSVK